MSVALTIMTTNYRLFAPYVGWLRLLWYPDTVHSAVVERGLQELARMPGVHRGPNGLAIPHTVFQLDAVADFLTAVGYDLQEEQTLTGPFGRWRDAEADLQRPLFAYQSAVLPTLKNKPGFLLADEMGLGKTATAIAATVCRGAYPVLILGPLFTRDVWRTELLQTGAIADESQFCALVTQDSDRRKLPEDVRFYFCHYDLIDYWWSALLFARKRRPRFVICDEAHRLRNMRTKRARGAHMVCGLADFRLLLTGTPMEHSPRDLWSLLTLTCGPKTWGTQREFRQRYCGAVFNGFGYEDTEATNVDELRKRMAPFYLRRTVADVGQQLPSLTRTSLRAESTQYALEKHHELLERSGQSMETLVRMILSGQLREVLPLLGRLRKLTSRMKRSTTLDYALSILESGDSAVVFCWERRTAEWFAQRLAAHAAYSITGAMSPADRAERVQWFQLAGGVLFATYGVLSEGVTLHQARHVVLHDLDWTLSTMLQAEKRIHRVGQHRACQSVWCIAEGTIDAVVAPVLQSKAAYAQQALGQREGLEALDDTKLQELTADDMDSEIEQAITRWNAWC